MPRMNLGARLYLDPRRKCWVIRDGNVFARTGCVESEREQAERKLSEYLAGHNGDTEGERVYFVRFGNKIKIGRAKDVKARLRSLQAMSPVPLKLLWSQPGGARIELQYHHKFKDCRAHGEWFEIRGGLRDFLSNLGVRV